MRVSRISRIVRRVKQPNLTADIQRRLRNEIFDAEPSQPSPNVRGPEESVLRPAIVENSLSPSLDGEGTAVWTLPLQVMSAWVNPLPRRRTFRISQYPPSRSNQQRNDYEHWCRTVERPRRDARR